MTSRGRAASIRLLGLIPARSAEVACGPTAIAEDTSQPRLPNVFVFMASPATLLKRRFSACLCGSRR
jgi:hypothetical protein